MGCTQCFEARSLSNGFRQRVEVVFNRVHDRFYVLGRNVHGCGQRFLGCICGDPWRRPSLAESADLGIDIYPSADRISSVVVNDDSWEVAVPDTDTSPQHVPEHVPEHVSEHSTHGGPVGESQLCPPPIVEITTSSMDVPPYCKDSTPGQEGGAAPAGPSTANEQPERLLSVPSISKLRSEASFEKMKVTLMNEFDQQQNLEIATSKSGHSRRNSCIVAEEAQAFVHGQILKGEYSDTNGETHDVEVRILDNGPPNTTGLEGLKNELKTYSELKDDPHVNVIKCFGGSLGDADWTFKKLQRFHIQSGRCFSVLEWAPTTLRMLLDDDSGELKGCTYRKMIKLFIDMADGLDHLHDSRIVHCDLTPENVHFGDGRAKLGGVHSSTIRCHRSMPWQLAGTFGYTAPELLFSHQGSSELQITDSVDVFSLGVIMLEVLTKKHPHEMVEEVCPELWAAVGEYCVSYTKEGGKSKSLVTTSDMNVRESLIKKLNEEWAWACLPWPNEFWALLKQKGDSESVSRSRENACEVLRHLESLVKSAWSGSLPWPPELCLLIAECASFVVEDGQDSVTRPSASEVSRRLKKMLGALWIDCCIPWGFDEASDVEELAPQLGPGFCCIDYEEMIGKGGFGRVYKGLYRDVEQKVHAVAIKVCNRPNDAPEIVQKELEAHEQIGDGGHENVVHCFGGNTSGAQNPTHHHMQRIINMGTEENFLVMELLERDLDKLLYRDDDFGKVCTYRDMIDIFIDIANGVEFLHAKRIVHQDLSPQNVLMDVKNTKKISDLGSAKIREMFRDSITPCPAGKAGYMAPEVTMQACIVGRKLRVTNKCDVFSLGKMILEFMARKHPMACGGVKGREELINLIVKCCECSWDENNCASRPSVGEVLEHLTAMKESDWADERLPWSAEVECRAGLMERAQQGQRHCCSYFEEREGTHSATVFRGFYLDVQANALTVDIKMPKHLQGESPLQGLKNELSAFDRLHGKSHSNVVHCFGGSLEDGDWTMENLTRIQMEGEVSFCVREEVDTNLERILHGDDVVGRHWAYVVQIFVDVAKGLEQLHENDIIHYDLNPANVLRMTACGYIKLGGLHASAIKSGKAMPWKLAGTLGYIAPELFFSQQGDSWVGITESIDVFSFGVMMLRVLTGRDPHEIHKTTCPEMWGVIDECCRSYSTEGGDSTSFLNTCDPIVRENLIRELNEEWMGAFLPWPDEFWSLLNDRGTSSVVDRTRENARGVVERLKATANDTEINASLPWPRELCLLIAECVNFNWRNGEYYFERPSASEIVKRLLEMQDAE